MTKVPEKLDENRVPTPEVLAAIEQLVTCGQVKSVFYSGYAHEAILRLLLKHLEPGGVSASDWWDRWGATEIFWWEGDLKDCPELVEWVRGVRFFQEGAPAVDLAIRDIPANHPIRVRHWLDGWGHRPPVKFLLLADEAREAPEHPDYTWTITPFYALATRKEKAGSGANRTAAGTGADRGVALQVWAGGCSPGVALSEVPAGSAVPGGERGRFRDR